MEIKKYKDINVEMIQQPVDPEKIMGMALNITMKKDFKDKKSLESVIKSVIDMNHTSVFEHLNYSFLIEGASRSFLAQMTRHRMASYTSGSQHYQNYSDYGANITNTFTSEQEELYRESLESSMEAYEKLIDIGMPAYEARQVLPNGMENNLIVSMNARSLMNLFNLRLCYRNTEEIQNVTEKMFDLVYPTYPPLWKNIGPDCYMSDCKQGKMSCGTPWEKKGEDYGQEELQFDS